MGRAETRVQVTAVTGETAHMGPVTTHPDVGSDGRSDQVILDAVGLRKRFDETQAVDDVSIRIHRGERVGIVGPNGAGKTTTLLMLLGAIDPDEGTIDLAGCRLPDGRSSAMGRVGFAAGYLPLPAGLTVTETLELFGALYGVDDPSTRAAQVLDEPTASLDPDVAMRVRDRLEHMNTEHRSTLLLTSHDMREVAELTTRVVFLRRGRIIADGPPDEVVTEHGYPDLEAMFLAEAARLREEAV